MSKTINNRVAKQISSSENVERLVIRRTKDQWYSLVVGLEILEYLANSDQPAELSALAARLDIPLATVYRAIRTMEDRGYVYPESGRGHRLSATKLQDLRAATPIYQRLLSHAEPVMQDLCNGVGQSCNLSVADGKQMVVIAATPSPGPFAIHVPNGYRYEIPDSAPGLTYLAFGGTADTTRRGKTGKAVDADVAAAIRLATERGYVQAENPCLPDVTDLCCPILDRRQLVATLSVPFIATTRSANKSWCLAALQQAAERLSHALDAGALVA
ncbi:MAG: helix-turn-helix domain-containing protein [Asticcacaulis sp.]|nr:helix-turn-helix domain-containing protein [Asticcacaulis sp.]